MICQWNKSYKTSFLSFAAQKRSTPHISRKLYLFLDDFFPGNKTCYFFSNTTNWYFLMVCTPTEAHYFIWTVLTKMKRFLNAIKLFAGESAAVERIFIFFNNTGGFQAFCQSALFQSMKFFNSTYGFFGSSLLTFFITIFRHSPRPPPFMTISLVLSLSVCGALAGVYLLTA